MANSKVNYWKWGIIVAAIIAAFLLGKCNERKIWKKNIATDTTVTTHTETIIDRPVPYKVVDSIPYPVYITETEMLPGQPYPVIEYKDVDTAAIIRQFFQIAYYDTTYKLQRGSARLLDTVHRNRIIGRSVTVTGADTTITKLIREPKRKVLYLEFNISGSKKNPFYSGGIGIALKDTSDRTYRVNASRTIDGHTLYQGGVGLPIFKW